MAIVALVPPGPKRDYFAGQAIPLPLQVAGAGGISSVPASCATVSIEHPPTRTSDFVTGELSFSYRTGADPQAPTYQSAGQFRALVCPRGPGDRLVSREEISRPAPSGMLHGHIGGKEVRLRSALAYLHGDGQGKTVISLRFHTGQVHCFSKLGGIPYLFGLELGPGDDGKYFEGRTIPVAWKLRVRKDRFSEQTVRARIDEGWASIHSVATEPGGQIRGVIRVDHDPAAGGDIGYQLEGTFRATVCGRRPRAW